MDEFARGAVIGVTDYCSTEAADLRTGIEAS
jgi:hypothetical protein